MSSHVPFQRYGGVAVCILVNSTVKYYKLGVINSCHGTGSNTNCNHLVTLIAYTADALIFKNRLVMVLAVTLTVTGNNTICNHSYFSQKQLPENIAQRTLR